MFRRNNIANRFACFILAAAMLVASLGFPFSAAAVGTFYVNLYTDDGWGNLTPLLPHEIEVDQTQPHLWLTLPADIPLNNVVAVFTTSDGSRAVIVMNEEGVPIALDTNGVTDYSYSEGEPFAFALLNEASEFIYQGQLTISYAPSPFATAEPTVTEEPYVEPSQEPAITPEPAPFPEGYNTSGHAWILSGTDLYDTPNGSSINSLNRVEEQVWETRAYELGSDNQWWAQIYYNGYLGWVPMFNLDYMSVEEEDAYLNPTPTPTPTPEPIITPEPAPFPEGYNTSGHAWILSGTDLYDTPNGNSINSLNRVEEQVWETRAYELGSDNQWWAQIYYNGYLGWVPMFNLDYMSIEEEDAYLNPTPTPSPTPTASPEPVVTEEPAPFPEGYNTSNHAWILVGTNLFDVPNGNAINSLDRREEQVWETRAYQLGSDNQWWAQIYYNGYLGWVPMFNLDYMSVEEEDAYLNPPPTPSPTPTASPTDSPTATPTNSPTPAPTFPPEIQSDYFRVTAPYAQFYGMPGSGRNLGELPPDGTVYQMLSNTLGSDGKIWVEILLNGQYGYVPLSTLTFLTPTEEYQYLHPTASPTNSPTPTPTASPSPTPTNSPTPAPLIPQIDPSTAPPTHTPSPTPTAVPPQVSGYAYISVQSPLLNWINWGAYTIEWMNPGDVVYIYEQSYGTDGTRWHWVIDPKTGNYGYVFSGNVRMMTPDEVSRYLSTVNRATPTPAPTTDYYSEFSGFGVTIVGGVNFRSAPGGAAKATLTKNTIVRLFESTTSGGYKWYRAEVSGIEGYLREDVIRLLTVREYLSAVTNPSYNTGGQIITPTRAPNVTEPPFVWTTPSITTPPNFITPGPSVAPLATPTPWATKDPFATPSTSPSAGIGLVGTVSPSPTSMVTLRPSASPSASPSMPVTGSSTGNGGGPGVLLPVVILVIILAGGLYGLFMYKKTKATARKTASVTSASAKPSSTTGAPTRPTGTPQRIAAPLQSAMPPQKPSPNIQSGVKSPASTTPATAKPIAPLESTVKAAAAGSLFAPPAGFTESPKTPPPSPSAPSKIESAKPVPAPAPIETAAEESGDTTVRRARSQKYNAQTATPPPQS